MVQHWRFPLLADFASGPGPTSLLPPPLLFLHFFFFCITRKHRKEVSLLKQYRPEWTRHGILYIISFYTLCNVILCLHISKHTFDQGGADGLDLAHPELSNLHMHCRPHRKLPVHSPWLAYPSWQAQWRIKRVLSGRGFVLSGRGSQVDVGSMPRGGPKPSCVACRPSDSPAWPAAHRTVALLTREGILGGRATTVTTGSEGNIAFPTDSKEVS